MAFFTPSSKSWWQERWLYLSTSHQASCAHVVCPTQTPSGCSRAFTQSSDGLSMLEASIGYNSVKTKLASTFSSPSYPGAIVSMFWLHSSVFTRRTYPPRSPKQGPYGGIGSGARQGGLYEIEDWKSKTRKSLVQMRPRLGRSLYVSLKCLGSVSLSPCM
jgi:hypothetical protein